MVDVTETPQVFGRNGNLAGIISDPPAEPRSSDPAVIILNAGIIHRVGPSRVSVELARALAKEGFRTLRFDLSGIGDSPIAEDGSDLSEAVLNDIEDAIDLISGVRGDDGGVVLFGICSGADNALCVAARDERVRGLVLVDPTVHPTTGFRLRRMLARATNPRTWRNVLSGRTILLRLRDLSNRDATPPPGYYGLLTLGHEETKRTARSLADRDVEFLYVITGGVREYCNYPGQIRDSVSGAIPEDQLRVMWRPQANHILTRREDRDALGRAMVDWLKERVAGRRQAPAVTTEG